MHNDYAKLWQIHINIRAILYKILSRIFEENFSEFLQKPEVIYRFSFKNVYKLL